MASGLGTGLGKPSMCQLTLCICRLQTEQWVIGKSRAGAAQTAAGWKQMGRVRVSESERE